MVFKVASNLSHSMIDSMIDSMIENTGNSDFRENRPSAFPALPHSDSSGPAKQLGSTRLHTIYFCKDLTLSWPWELPLCSACI